MTQSVWWFALCLPVLFADALGQADHLQHTQTSQGITLSDLEEGWGALTENGQNLLQAGRYSEAEKSFRQALRIARKFGSTDERLAATFSNIGVACSHTGNYAEAERQYKAALSIDEANRLAAPSDLARDLNNLAVLYERQHRDHQSESVYRHALDIASKALTAERPAEPMTQESGYVAYFDQKFLDFRSTLNNFADYYRRRHRYSDAVALLKRGLEMDSRYLGQYKAAEDLDNLAMTYVEEGRNTEAESTFVRHLLSKP
jgi:tetratricopeptide (TPR) repeat protein